MPSHVKLFISHRSTDRQLAEAIAKLARQTTGLAAAEVRCTSVDGYRLPGGADTSSQLREELLSATALIGIVTPAAITSAYVLFELGARWGAAKRLWPVLARRAHDSVLTGPLAETNALHLTSRAEVIQLVDELATSFGVTVESWPSVQKEIDDVIKLASEVTAAAPSRWRSVRTWAAMSLGLLALAAVVTNEKWRPWAHARGTYAHVVTCVVATQPQVTGGVNSGSRSCSIPDDVIVSGATLDYTLDDGGEVSIDGEMVFGLAPEAGIDTGTVVLPTKLFTPGSSFIVKVTARNAPGPDGSFGSYVHGLATVRVATLSKSNRE